MSLGEERIRIVEETLKKEEQKLCLKNNELTKIWQYEYGLVADDARNLINDIDDQIKISLKDIDYEKFLAEENGSVNFVQEESDVSEED